MKYNFSKNHITIFALLLCAATFGCSKQNDWLNAKRLKSDVSPITLADFQAILDNSVVLNTRLSCVGLMESDNLYINDINYKVIDQAQQALYTFGKEVWINGNATDWNNQYATIEYSNIVLDGLKSLSPSESGYSNVKGQALFFRALSLYTLSQIFCRPYSKQTASADLGVPVRLTSDVNVLYQRGTLAEVFKQILDDLSLAGTLLDKTEPYNGRRPTAYAAYGLLAHIYLVMGDFKNAGDFADKALSAGATLLDFNNTSIVKPTSTYRFPANGIGNPEIIFFGSCQTYSIIADPRSQCYVDSSLFNSYDDNDLRKSCLYNNQGKFVTFQGSYTGSYPIFCGVAVNEMYLIRSECYARLGNIKSAMADLNTLLKNRYKTGTYADLAAPNADSALQIILKERRKELPLTGQVRWEDLRRLNTDPRFQMAVKHVINSNIYSLAPNDPKYALPIPANEIQISGIQQNER